MDQQRHRVDFFQVLNGQTGALPFDRVLREIWRKPAPQRIKEIGDYCYSLYHLEERPGGFLCGEVGRLRTDMVDRCGDRRGGSRPMPVGDDEGQLRSNYFAYHGDTRCLAMLFQQSGVRSARLQQYVLEHCGPDCGYVLQQLIREEMALRLLGRMKCKKKMTLGIRVPNNGQLLREAGLADDGVIAMARRHHAAAITVEMSLGGQDGTLQQVKSFFQKYLPCGDIVTKARVIGVDEEDGQQSIDFLRMMMRAEVTIDISRSERGVHRGSAYNALIGATDGSLAEIRRVSDGG